MHCLVMNSGMMFCHIVTIVFFACGLVVSKLASTFSVPEPMVCHIHCFQFFDDVVVDNAECSGVVCLHWCWRLGMTHEIKSISSRDGLFAVYVESSHLSLCHWGHDCCAYFCNCEDGAIVCWFWRCFWIWRNVCPPGCVLLILRGRMHSCDLQGPCHLHGMWRLHQDE